MEFFFESLFFFRMDVHPAVTVSNLKEQLDALVDAKEVDRRPLSGHEGLSIYKYKDRPKIKGLARLARGLVMNPHGECVNLPMPKFDEIAPYNEDMDEYHASVEAALPEICYVQPKHDGTCIHAVCCEDGSILVTSFLSNASPQAVKAREILGDHRWARGTTLGFELIDERDPKVQEKRVADGLYLFYGATKDGQMLSRDELSQLATQLRISIVKQQRLSKQATMKCLRRIDEVDTIRDVQEGMIAIDGHKRAKIKSHKYLSVASTVKPSKAWLHQIVKKAKALEDVHDAVERFEGPMDVAAIACNLLVDALAVTRDTIDELKEASCIDVETIKSHPKKILVPFLFKQAKDPFFCDSEQAILQVLSSVLSKSA